MYFCITISLVHLSQVRNVRGTSGREEGEERMIGEIAPSIIPKRGLESLNFKFNLIQHFFFFFSEINLDHSKLAE